MSDMTDEEFALYHFGVKGMKWGKRKAEGGGSSGPSRSERKQAKKEARAKEDEEIDAARERLREKNVALERQAFKTYSANGEKAAKAALNKYDKMQADLLKDPDNEIASKLNSGERAAARGSLIWGTVAIAAYLGTSAAVSKMARG